MSETVTFNKGISPGKKPPLSWFRGNGSEDKGILSVGLSRKLLSMDDGIVSDLLEEWCLVTNNPVIKGHPPVRDEEERKKIADANEEYIKKVTGFIPQEILDEVHQLGINFEGKKSAPFEFKLY